MHNEFVQNTDYCSNVRKWVCVS